MSNLLPAIAQLQADEASLSLSTVDLAFLVTMRFKLKTAGLGCLDQEATLELYGRVAEQVDPSTRNPRKKATESLERLRRTRILTRIERGRAMRAADYDLSALGQAIADHYLEVRNLTDRDLRLLTGELRLQLEALGERAADATTAEDWADLTAALHGPVAALSEGLDLRRRGLDREQEAVKDEVAALLDDEWVQAAMRCEALLDRTSRILSELNDVLVGETSALHDALEPLALAARSSEHSGNIHLALRDARLRIQALSAWGQSRQQAWTEYLQSVQRFIRDIVRMDPDRATARKLADALVSWGGEPWFLVVADAPVYRTVEWRDDQVFVPEATHAASDYAVGHAPAPPAIAAQLDRAVAERLAERGGALLSELVDELLASVPADERYRAIGFIAHALARHGRLEEERAPSWVDLELPYAIEEQLAVFEGSQP